MKKKKILIVGPDQSLKGGVAHHIRTLLASPLNENFELKYFKIGSGQNDSRSEIFLKFVLAPFRFLWKLRTFWPDVVHFNPSFDMKSIIRELNLAVLCKIFKRPTLLQFHGGTMVNFINNGRIPFYLKMITNLTSHLVVLTDIQKAPLLKFCPVKKITVIPNMVDTALFSTKNDRYRSHYRILYMSKIESKKGIFDVIDSVQDVIKKIPNVTFLFAGDGPDKEKLKLLCCEYGLEDHVKLMGYVQEKKKATFLSRGDIFLFPSQYDEGMPYSLIEAMAAGLPIIATTMGGVPDVIEDRVNGFLIPSQHPEQLAQATIKLLSNSKARKKIGRLNRIKAATEYDITIVSKKFSRLYEKLSEHH